ncbi:MAG: DUF1540 domain-containing protein [Clostridia bacterium]|nr:DUF1540 domain-containing protein [Clostridia bacterium]
MDNCNCRVKCNVCECVHNGSCNTCNLDCIEITHEKTANDVVATPHFCKSFCKKANI